MHFLSSHTFVFFFCYSVIKYTLWLCHKILPVYHIAHFIYLGLDYCPLLTSCLYIAWSTLFNFQSFSNVLCSMQPSMVNRCVNTSFKIKKKTCRKCRNWIVSYYFFRKCVISSRSYNPLRPFRFAEARCLLSDHSATHPPVRHTLRPSPVFCGADRSGLCERLRGPGHARWQGASHWGRYALIGTWTHTHIHPHT